MKQLWKMLCGLTMLGVLLLQISGCSVKETKASVVQDRPEPDDADQVGEAKISEDPKISVRIYHSDEQTESLCVNTAKTEKVTPEILILNLASYKMLPDTVAVQSFQQEEEDGGRLLKLDLSEEFGTYLASVETEREIYVIGSLVNTFLDAYKGAGICITVSGKPLETEQASYDEYLDYYPYQEASYSVETAEINESGVHIKYPQISGLKDTDIQDYWNETIRERVQEFADKMLEGAPCEWEGTYTIKTMNNELLSILMDGGGYQEGAAHPFRQQYTYNIDMVTGENIRLAHFEDVEKVAENLMNGTGFAMDGKLSGEFHERLEILYGSAEQLAVSLKGYDYCEGQEFPQGYSYQENGKTHLCMEVPHALGDYVDITLE